MNTKLFEKANKMIKIFEYASFGVIGENGYPSVSAISLWLDDEGVAFTLD